MTPLWIIRILFLSLCVTAGYAISQVRPEFVGRKQQPVYRYGDWFWFWRFADCGGRNAEGIFLRAFSATTFGLLLGTGVAMLIDHSGLFDNAEEKVRWLIRLGLFLGFCYIASSLPCAATRRIFRSSSLTSAFRPRTNRIIYSCSTPASS
ncbi:MAG: hypothetical protein WDM76_06045 [Limisphaerales bacterium]